MDPRLIALLLSAMGCGEPVSTSQHDSDADGVTGSHDCDDASTEVHPGAVETCDGIDNDCDGEIDDADADVTGQGLYYADADHDSYGAGEPTEACEKAAGTVTNDLDCDDGDASIFPGAPHECNGLDNDCDGTPDDETVSYADQDGDGWGDPSSAATACDAPDGYVENHGDCDDDDPLRSPDAPEVCGDVDDDCDGLVDDEDPDLTDATTWYRDDDGDGWGVTTSTTTACEAPVGYASASGDCDDLDDDFHPGASETDCHDPSDYNCDGSVGDADLDADGFPACEDCDDTDALDHPGATEITGNEDDETCDGLESCYVDGDGDGYRTSTVTLSADTDCSDAGEASSADPSGDCDDLDALRYPGASEVVGNGQDDSCDGSELCYVDADDDGYRLTATVSSTDADCWDSGEAVSSDPTGDCDDTEALANPSESEVCGDGIDNDCDETANQCLAGGMFLDFAEARLRGDDDDRAGTAVARAGDLNMDGFDDLFVGAPYDDLGAGDGGTAFVVFGPVSGEHPLTGAEAQIMADSSNDRVGSSLAAGDVDGDGYPDVLVGGPGDDAGGTGAGAAYFLYGPVSGLYDLAVAGTWDSRLLGESGDDHAGYAVASGDLDGDGFSDLVVGAYGDDDSAAGSGAAYLVLGPISADLDLGAADGKACGEAASDNTGDALAVLGDLDADGTLDVIIGAHQEDTGGSNAGAAYVIDGAFSGSIDLSVADAFLVGEAAGDNAGYAVAGAGDIDGDGSDDVIVGAPFHAAGGTDAGAAYVVLGPISPAFDLGLSDAILVGESPGDHAGSAVSGAGDVDRDGHPDLLIGGERDDNGGTDAGAAYLVYGPISGSMTLYDADLKLVGEAVDDYAGAAVAAAGDTNGDGFDDLLVGAAYNGTAGATSSGAAYLVLGGGW